MIWKKRRIKNMLRLFYKQMFIVLIVIIVLFLIIGLITTTKPSSRLSSSIFSSWTSHVDQSIFLFMYGLENTSFSITMIDGKNRPQAIESFFDIFTSIRLDDLKSLLGHELPGFSTYENRIIIAGEGLHKQNILAHESGPPLEDIIKDRKAIDDTDDQKKEEPIEKPEKPFTTEGRKVVFLYNSHNRESFLPHLPDESEPNAAHHKEVNITRVSERLANTLESYGIGTLVDNTDIMNILHKNGWKYSMSYRASRPVIQEAIGQNKHLQYLIDIHRDALPRKNTTKKINNESYAQILFVVGAEHKNHEKNLTLATKLHYLIEKKYPGLSKGVILKEAPKSNGVYNQDLHENALLVEIGGFENTLDEMYRTADVLAEVFSDYYWDAEKVMKIERGN